MFFRMLYDDTLAQASYLIGCQRTGEGLVVDPERDVQRYLDLADREGLRIVAIAETHIHADFLSGSRELAERTSARVYLSNSGGEEWKYRWPERKQGGAGAFTGGSYDHDLLTGGDRFKVGMIEFEALHTPGHTPEHLCYLITDRSNAHEPMGILSGDFVFVGDVGRPDLLESAAGQAGAALQSARWLYQSLQGFFNFPGYLQLWPGHGAGSACGKALGAVPQSTVGYEKLFNPAVLASQESEARFIEEILTGQTEPPYYFARMKHDNQHGPKPLEGWPEPPALRVHELLERVDQNAIIVDTRPWLEFRMGHLPGALHVPLTNDFSTLAGSYIEPEKTIYLIAPDRRGPEAIAALIRIGLDNIAGRLEPQSLAEYQSKGGKLRAIEEIDGEELQRRVQQNGVCVLDVRSAFELELGRISGALNIAHTRLLPRLREIPRDRPLVVHCQKGDRSPGAVAMLAHHGYEVVHLANGLRSWLRAGGELEVN
ncbi:MAG: MBL fold metallo-hydrolase [bacterium]